MQENQSKVFGARRRSDSCLRKGFLNVPRLNKARGVSSNNSLSSCIIILHFKTKSNFSSFSLGQESVSAQLKEILDHVTKVHSG